LTLPDFWKFLAGLGFFIYGMFHLEDVMKQIEGRGFKLFLQKHTKNKLSAIFSGTLITGIMQSSSIVNLMVLSFVGAGMLSMRNAIAVTLGANVGGTFNSWLVALLGFKVDIGKFALPIIGLAGTGLIVLRNKKKFYEAARFCMGFGLLFLGLQYMKDSMDSVVKNFDFTPYLNYPRIVFVLIGLIITALIQTSAATIVIVLTALYAKIIPIETAVAVVIGAELGTTLKLLVGSIGGMAAKKRVAVGNILFNIATSLAGFFLLIPIIHLLKDSIGIHDPIFILVAFQTTINVGGVVVFYFMLNAFGDFLEKRFVKEEKTVTQFIQSTSPEISDTAMDMMQKEVGLFIYRAIHLNREVFQITGVSEAENEFEKYDREKSLFSKASDYEERYRLVKQAEGEILSFYSKMVMEIIEKENLTKLNQWISSVRNAMYSAKGMKDINNDRKEFSNSVNKLKYESYEAFRTKLSNFYRDLTLVFTDKNRIETSGKLLKLLEDLQVEYDEILKNSYKEAANGKLTDVDISTLFNVNRELHSSCRALVFSTKDYLLDVESAAEFENLPLLVVKK